MQKTLKSLVAAALTSALLGASATPTTPRGDTSDMYFGMSVPNPYRWLEHVGAPEVLTWSHAQNAAARLSLNALPSHATFLASAFRLAQTPRDGMPSIVGSATIWNTFVSGHGWVTMARTNGRQRVLLDPTRRWPDGLTVVTGSQVSPDGKYLTYVTEHAGDGWSRWFIMDVGTGKTTDEITGIPDWGRADWAADSSGLYYAGYGSESTRPSGEPVGVGYRDMFHRLHSKQSKDTLIYQRPDEPTWLPFVRNSSDGRYLLATEGDAQRSILVRRVGDHGPFHLIRSYKNADYSYVYSSGYNQYFLTTDGAPRGKLVRIDRRQPSRSIDVIRETGLTLDSVGAAGVRFVTHYLKDGHSDLRVYDRTGALVRHIPLPGVGTASFVPDGLSSIGYITFTSISVRFDVYSYDVARNIRRRILHTSQPFAASDFVTDVLFAPSTGGARVPVFVAHRRGIHLDGRSRVLLTGYGGFGASYNPQWQTLSALWLERGGIFAIADVRGGGEYGDAWHRSGMRGEKQHVFDDFAAAARLIESRGYGSPRTLGAYGYSGGGLLVGVSEVEHPELFGAVAEGAGPLDVLRGYTYGSEASWASEVGSPVASREQFNWLYSYAPLVAIKRGDHYPPTLVMTSQNDATVSPAHAYKFAATLQWALGSNATVLLSVASDSGHMGNSTSSAMHTVADVDSFLWSHLSP